MGNYEFDGEKYKQASRYQKEWGNELISQLNLSGNEIILDLGCGDGVLTEQIAGLVPNGKVIGVDASAGMIHTAKKLEKDNLTFICMDINDMDFADQFDIIYSNAALHWVKNHSLLLQNSCRALKANGIIEWHFAGDGTCSTFNDTVSSVMNEDAFKEYFLLFEWPWFMPSEAAYKELAAHTDYRVMDIKFENADRYFSTCDEMVKWIDQPCIVPFLEPVPEEQKEAFRNRVVSSMIAGARQPDGRCFETFRRIHIHAVK